MATNDNITFDELTGQFEGVTPEDIKHWKELCPYLDFDDDPAEFLEEASWSVVLRYIDTPPGKSLSWGQIDPVRKHKVCDEVNRNPQKALEDYFFNQNFIISSMLSDGQKQSLRTVGKGPRDRELSWRARAIALLWEHRNWTIEDVAKTVGKTRQALYADPDLNKAIEARRIQKQAPNTLPHGERDDETGKIEAWR